MNIALTSPLHHSRARHSQARGLRFLLQPPSCRTRCSQWTNVVGDERLAQTLVMFRVYSPPVFAGLAPCSRTSGSRRSLRMHSLRSKRKVVATQSDPSSRRLANEACRAATRHLGLYRPSRASSCNHFSLLS